MTPLRFFLDNFKMRFFNEILATPGPYQVIPHQVITGEQGKKYCETLPAPFERHDSEFSGDMPIEKTNIESLNLPCHNGLHIVKA